MIRNILILKETGENLFSKSFGKATMNETLTSGFISAAFNFTQSTFGANIENLELGAFRVLFEKGKKVIVVAFFDRRDSIINVKNKLAELRDLIETQYCTQLERSLCRADEFEDLGPIIEKVVSDTLDKTIKDEIRAQFIEILDKFRSNDEILDADIISVYGVPMSQEWKKAFLELCLRQMDAFWKSQKYSLDQIIMSYGNRHVILYKVNNELILTALIKRNTPMGLATLLVEETAEKIAKISSENANE